MRTITLYTQPGCQPCKAVKRWLTSRNIPHETVDVSLPENAGDLSAIKSLGYQGTPVTIVSTGDPETDLHWHGFNPDFLDRYTKEKATA